MAKMEIRIEEMIVFPVSSFDRILKRAGIQKVDELGQKLTAPILTLALDEIIAKKLASERGVRSGCKIIDLTKERAG